MQPSALHDMPQRVVAHRHDAAMQLSQQFTQRQVRLGCEPLLQPLPLTSQNKRFPPAHRPRCCRFRKAGAPSAGRSNC